MSSPSKEDPFSGHAHHFESLCARVQGGGDLPAQKELVSLRETAAPDMCLQIARRVLENTRCPPYAHYEALALLEAAVLRQPSDSLVILRYLLERAASKAAVQQRAVTRKMLDVSATIYKRSFQPTKTESGDVTQVDCVATEFREVIWHILGIWLASPVWEMQLLGMELLKNVFSHFQVSSSRNMGLTVDYHYRCHVAFEELYLRKVFFMSKSVIEEVLKQERPASVACLAALRVALEIVVDLLQWNWNATISLSTYIWAAVRSLNERTTVSASDEWVAIIKQPMLFEMFGVLFRRFRTINEEIARLSLRGLEQMASFLIMDKVSGPIQPGRPPATFIELLVTSVTQLLVSLCEFPNTTKQEVFHAAGIVSRMAANQHVRYLMFLPNWFQFLQAFGKFTEMTSVRLLSWLASKGANDDEDVESVESSKFMISYSTSLHAWGIFGKYAVYRTATDTAQRHDHPDVNGPSMHALKDALGRVYNLYVRTRLNVAFAELEMGLHDKPSLLQKPKTSTDKSEDPTFDEGVVEEEVSDQLLDGALTGRAHLATAVPLIGSRLRDAIAALGNVENNQALWQKTVEEIHWLLLLAGHLIADTAEWELNSAIPRVVSQYETASNGHVVQLIRQAFSLLDWEAKCFETNRKHLLSPLVSATLLWFCERIVRTFFFRVRRSSDGSEGPTPRQDVTSESFITNFSSMPLFNQFIEQVRVNLMRWSGNDEVLVPTARLLKSCCSTNRLSYKLMGLPAYQKLLSHFSHWTLDQVASPVHRKVVAALCQARISESSQVCDEYYTNVLASLMAMIQKIADPSFVFTDSSSIKFCSALLEKLNGVTDGTTSQNVVKIRHFFFSCLPGFKKLMDVYKQDSSLYVPLVRLCTRFVTSQSECCSSWVTSDLNVIFDMAMMIIRFCRSGALRSTNGRWTREQEREQYQLLKRLIFLLMALLQLVSTSGSANQNKEAQVDVILFGLAALLSYISETLLDYPKLRLSYYSLLKRLLNMYPERFGMLPPDLFSRLMTTLMYALKHADEKIQRCAVKGLKELFSSHARNGTLLKQAAMNSGVVTNVILVTFRLLVQNGSLTRILPSCSAMLMSLIMADRPAWITACKQFASSASTPNGAAHVLRACMAVTENVNFTSPGREMEEMFRENIKAFVLETRGIEWRT